MIFEKLKEMKRTVDYEKLFISPEILHESHKRCRESRVRTDLERMPVVLNNLEVDNLLEDSKLLLSVARPVMREAIYPNFTDEDQIIILCNSGAYAVDLMSSPEVLKLCYRMNIGNGSCFQEEVCGTNAIALALRMKSMTVIKGEQHYCKLFKDWTSVAALIKSPGGDIIGCLDISMHSQEKLGHTAALVQLATKHIERIYAEKLAAEILPEVVISPELLSRFDTLSRREKEVFRLLAEEKTIGKIAEEIGINFDTAKTYQKRVYKKLGARNRIDCLKKARELDPVIE